MSARKLTLSNIDANISSEYKTVSPLNSNSEKDNIPTPNFKRNIYPTMTIQEQNEFDPSITKSGVSSQQTRKRLATEYVEDLFNIGYKIDTDQAVEEPKTI
jgi:hypothetical protein